MARSEPPGRLPLLHRVPISAVSHRLSPASIASAYADCSAAFSHPGEANLRQNPKVLALSTRLPSASRLLDVDMSLSTSFSIAAVAQRRSQVCRNPCAIQADSEPPGRRPPAPGSLPRRTHSVAGGPFASFGGLRVGRLAPVTDSLLSSSRNPKLWDEPL